MAITNEALDVAYDILNKYITTNLEEMSRPNCDVRTQLIDRISKNFFEGPNSQQEDMIIMKR